MDEEQGSDLIRAYICVIKSLVACSEEKGSYPGRSCFYASRIPHISIDDYILRIVKYFQCSYECYICSLVYIDMLLRNDQFILNEYSIHRVILTTVMTAAKFYDDSFFNNELYARIGGVSVDELNALELEFVFLINFSLLITEEEFQKYYNELYTHCNSICNHCRDIHIPYLDYITSSSFSVLSYSHSRISNGKRHHKVCSFVC